MSVPFQDAAFTLGEVSPGMYGRQDLARLKVGVSTARNCWPKFSGGLYSRAGTAFTGFSKQTGRTYAPRMIPFQFSINQGLALEFGNYYMRVVSNGAYVTEAPIAASGITHANPAVVTYATRGATVAVPIATAVTSTYSINEQVTLAGGVGISPILKVTATQLVSAPISAAGIGNYAPADTITASGGTASVPAILTVATTKVVSATVAAAGAGGTDGTQTVTGTTGTGTKFQALVTVLAGAVTAVLAISVAGSYTVNPTTPAAEPVTGAALAGAQLSVVLGVSTVTITTAGTYSVNPGAGLMTQGSTSGTGTGAQFSPVIMGPKTVSILSAGAYSSAPPNPAAQATSTRTGLGATFTMTYAAAQGFFNGDWVQAEGAAGMTQINGQVYVVANATATTFQLADVYGNNIDSTTFGVYTGGATMSRIYTVVSPYAEQDLPWLKFTQSADVMSICCLNQESGTAYQPEDLTRFSDTNWVFTPVSPAATISPPSGVAASASAGGTTYYQYVVTAVNPADGSESIASSIAYVDAAVNVAATAGTITISWSAIANVTQYNIYKGAATFAARAPTGVPFGVIGQASGVSFTDSGEVPDFTTTPPLFRNPFDILRNYPGTVAYIQQRRAYASTLNNPDTYYMSQPGSFTNFDTRSPTIDSDAITGTPWSTQVDGIQFMVSRPGGLVVLTGREAWQLTGTGGSSLNPQPLTPSSQQAQPQAFNGCHNHVPPLGINEDILYVQAKGSVIRGLTYTIQTNIYTGADLTVNSSHLFSGFQIVDWAWCEEPYKLVWAVRSDGALLSLSYLKAEGILGWARHDTNGSFVSVCSVTEPPVDALYCAVQRKIGSNTAYTVERMDDRIWAGVEDTWCVDSGLALPQPQPDAILTLSSATGAGTCSAITGLVGGTGYSTGVQLTVIDDNGLGPGTGAIAVPTVVGGVITAVAFSPGGTGYVSPKFAVYDPAGSEGGSGFSATITLSNTATASTSAGVFNSGSVGSVIRAQSIIATNASLGSIVRDSGGTATITVYNSPTNVTVSITEPFTGTTPDSNGYLPPIPSGSWSMTAPVSMVTGLAHLAGATVTGRADGSVIAPQVVSAAGTITLAMPASSVVVGLGFVMQVQSLYLNPGDGTTVQGQRKKVGAVTCRVEASRGFYAGANQVDGSTVSPPILAPTWNNLTAVPNKGVPAYASGVIPLYSGDIRVMIPGGWDTKGQVAIQQSDPMPLNLLNLIPEGLPGDLPQLKVPQRDQSRGKVAA